MASAVSVKMTGDDKVLSLLTTTQKRARIVSKELPGRWAIRLQKMVRKNARSFRRTGEYDKSIQVRDGVVYTRHHAARRLEFGFVGYDATGRHYSQAPKAHWRPAVQTMASKMPSDVKKELGIGH
jgi:hypothetical protein